MKPELFIPVGVFLAVSLPVVWLLDMLNALPEYRVWLAIGAGAVATGYAQNRLAAKAEHALADQKNREQQA